jgi:hypothetical protein
MGHDYKKLLDRATEGDSDENPDLALAVASKSHYAARLSRHTTSLIIIYQTLLRRLEKELASDPRHHRCRWHPHEQFPSYWEGKAAGNRSTLERKPLKIDTAVTSAMGYSTGIRMGKIPVSAAKL